MDEYEQAEKKYGLVLPESYRSMCAAGWCDVKSDNYFWFYEAEWMSLTEILNYKPAGYHKPGFVLFAFTGGGDHWCWWPSEHPGAVVLCPHDENEGTFYAPSFMGFVYRCLLDYGRYVSTEDTDEDELRQNLHEAARLFPCRLAGHAERPCFRPFGAVVSSKRPGGRLGIRD